MLSFVPDGRECLANAEQRESRRACDRRRARHDLDVGTTRQERTACRRLIVVDFTVVNLRRHERLHRWSLLRVMRKMRGVIAANESGARLAAEAGTRHHEHNTAIGNCDLDAAGQVVGAITRDERRRLQRNKDERVTGSRNCEGMSLVRKAITFEGQAICAKTVAAESHRDRSAPKPFVLNWNTARRKRLVSGNAECRLRVPAGSQLFVHRRGVLRRQITGDLRMLRSGDNGLQNQWFGRVSAELLVQLLVDTAAAARTLHCRGPVAGCPMATRMSMLSESVTRIETLP